MHRHIGNHWHFYGQSERRLVRKESKDPEDEQVLDMAERTDGAMSASRSTSTGIDAAYEETEELIARTEEIKNEKGKTWRSIAGKFVTSMGNEAEKHRQMSEEIDREVRRRMQETVDEAWTELNENLNRMELKVIEARVREQVLNDMKTHLERDRQYMEQMQENMQQWKDFLDNSTGMPISVDYLKSAPDLEALRTRIGLTKDLDALEKKNAPDAEKVNNSLEWARSTETTILQNLQNLQLDPSETLMELYEDHLQYRGFGKSELAKKVEAQMGKTGMGVYTLDSLNRIRNGGKVFRVLEKLDLKKADALPLPQRIQKLKSLSAIGTKVEFISKSTTVRTMLHSVYTAQSGRVYLVFRNQGAGPSYLSLNTENNQLLLRQSSGKVTPFVVDDKSTSLRIV